MCTGIRLIADNGCVIYARTLEFAQPIDSQILFIPRKYAFQGTAPTGPGLAWTSNYAVLGANASHTLGLVDGLNEAGLAGGLFYFPGFVGYQPSSPKDGAKTLAPWELITWILTSFSTIDQVKKHLNQVLVASVTFEPWGIVPPIHAIVHDPQGKSLVIEFTAGVCRIFDNPLGIITNSPSFDWHLTNLNNYLNLSPMTVTQKQLGPLKLQSMGQGSGLHGLPGDFTSPSRFVRAAAITTSLVDLTDEHQALDAAFHVLNLFDIPKGAVRSDANLEITQWTSAADLTHRCYYMHTYDNRTVQRVDLGDFELTSAAPVFIPLQKKSPLIELTSMH